MAWEVQFHEAFAEEFDGFDPTVKIELAALTALLERFGPQLSRPHADTLKGSKHPNMKELRFRADDGVWRVAFAFDPERNAVLLVAGDKAGVAERRFYKQLIETADRRFTEHVQHLGKKGG